MHMQNPTGYPLPAIYIIHKCVFIVYELELCPFVSQKYINDDVFKKDDSEKKSLEGNICGPTYGRGSICGAVFDKCGSSHNNRADRLLDNFSSHCGGIDRRYHTDT